MHGIGPQPQSDLLTNLQNLLDMGQNNQGNQNFTSQNNQTNFM